MATPRGVADEQDDQVTVQRWHERYMFRLVGKPPLGEQCGGSAGAGQ